MIFGSKQAKHHDSLLIDTARFSNFTSSTMSIREMYPSFYTIHANFLEGYDTKIQKLKELGLWLVTDENRLSCEGSSSSKSKTATITAT